MRKIKTVCYCHYEKGRNPDYLLPLLGYGGKPEAFSPVVKFVVNFCFIFVCITPRQDYLSCCYLHGLESSPSERYGDGDDTGVETTTGCNNGIVARIRMVPDTVPSDWADGRSVV
jgi:hypothetical protein